MTNPQDSSSDKLPITSGGDLISKPGKTVSPDRELRRREFFHRAAAATGSTVVASIALSASASAENTEKSAQAHYNSENEAKEPFPGYDLMIYAYGHIPFKELFKENFACLIPIVSKRVGMAADNGLIPRDDAERILDLLAMILREAPRLTLEDMYTLNTRAMRRPEDFSKVQDACREIDGLGLRLTFAYQIADEAIISSAKKVFHPWHDDGLRRPNGIGEMTLAQVYAAPVPKNTHGDPDKRHPHVRAIANAKRAALFGPKPEMDPNSRNAYRATFFSATKGNSRACRQSGGCSWCADDECYCSTTTTGACSLMSDSYEGNC
jgi:hypothetical protein